jgi:hypothetical protein
VRFIAYIANIARGEFADEQLIEFCRSVDLNIDSNYFFCLNYDSEVIIMITRELFELEDLLEEVRTFSAKHPNAYWHMNYVPRKLSYSFEVIIDEDEGEDDIEFSFTIPIARLTKDEAIKLATQQCMIASTALDNAKKELIELVIGSTETMREKLLMH